MRSGARPQAQGAQAAREVFLGRVDLLQGGTIDLKQGGLGHLGLEIGAAEGLAAGALDEAPLAGEPAFELRAGQGRQDADHGLRDGRAQDPFALSVQGGAVVGVEAHDETRVHVQAIANERVDGLVEIHRQVLTLVGFAQGLGEGVSMPTNTQSKPAATMPAMRSLHPARSTLASVKN